MNKDWVDKDFYKVLGVAKDAPQDEIKRAYRKLAQKHHPDANPDNPSAESKFKDISEAYATLSNEEHRTEYDQVRRMVDSGGFQGFGGGGGPFAGGQRVRVEDLGDLLGGAGGLGDLFGFSSGSGRTGPRRGADHHAELHLSFEDAFHGVTTSVAVEGEAACRRCGGSGGEPGTQVQVCPTCRGAGTVAQSQGFFSISQPCPQCRGNGKLVEQPCSTCHGRGSEVRSRTIRVKIPAGVAGGSAIRLRGKGAPGNNGGPAGDLIVRVHVARHPIFHRKGQDLTVRVPITFTEAALGTALDVPTLNGPVKLKVAAGTRSGKTFRVRGRGVPRARGKAGDLLVTVEVAVPQKLPRAAKKMLEQFAEEFEQESPRAHLEV
ncbi:MAG: molecular chaperone DnaJ [Acidimicrobiia bacterium]|nr:molecular chaperone DnaJ [Acidimicrobiia bacterium]